MWGNMRVDGNSVQKSNTSFPAKEYNIKNREGILNQERGSRGEEPKIQSHIHKIAVNMHWERRERMHIGKPVRAILSPLFSPLSTVLSLSLPFGLLLRASSYSSKRWKRM